MEVTMANEGDRGSTNPSHPRMSAGLPQGGTSTPTGESLVGKVSEAAGQVRERIRETASGVAERAGEAWDSTRQGFEQAAQRAQDFWTDAGNLVRRRPLASLAVAVGGGCLVGSLLTTNWGRPDDMTRRMSRASA
jgi:ElaB/YqjD/DUF883 family membrane-anchored ribosome-binding protein